MEWAAKSGYSTWLSEGDLAKYFLKEARDYIERLKKEKSKRLSGIVKIANPLPSSYKIMNKDIMIIKPKSYSPVFPVLMFLDKLFFGSTLLSANQPKPN